MDVLNYSEVHYLKEVAEVAHCWPSSVGKVDCCLHWVELVDLANSGDLLAVERYSLCLEALEKIQQSIRSDNALGHSQIQSKSTKIMMN